MTQPAEAVSNGSAGTTLRQVGESIVNSLRMILIEEFRDETFGRVAAEMYPPRKDEKGVEEPERILSDDEEGAVTARIRDEIERFKLTVDKAVASVPLDEEGFIDPRGDVWKMPDSAGTYPVPLPSKRDAWHVYAMFDRNGDSVAVYVFPVAERDKNGKPVTFARLILSRHVASASWKVLGLDAFKREIVDEMRGAYYEYYGSDGHLAAEQAES